MTAYGPLITFKGDMHITTECRGVNTQKV